MKRKIQKIRQLCKEKGFSLRCGWAIETPNYYVMNSRLGGWREMILVGIRKKDCQTYCGIHWTEEVLDEIFAELKKKFNS